MKNSVNPADQAIYDMFPWKINERNQFDPTFPPPKDPNTGERLDYWYTGEDWIKTHLPLQESLLRDGDISFLPDSYFWCGGRNDGK